MTDGAVGPDHFVQQVNIVVQVFNKAGVPAAPPFRLSSLFAPIGGHLLGTTDRGDPIVLYDQLSDRWMLSQFAFTALNAPPYHQCIAISKTNDPTGAYFVYDFVTAGQRVPRLSASRSLAGRLLHDGPPVHPRRTVQRHGLLCLRPQEDARRRSHREPHLLQFQPGFAPGGRRRVTSVRRGRPDSSASRKTQHRSLTSRAPTSATRPTAYGSSISASVLPSGRAPRSRRGRRARIRRRSRWRRSASSLRRATRDEGPFRSPSRRASTSSTRRSTPSRTGSCTGWSIATSETTSPWC